MTDVLLDVSRGLHLWQGAVLMIQTEFTGFWDALAAGDQAHRDVHDLVHVVPQCSGSNQLQASRGGSEDKQTRTRTVNLSRL